MDEENQNVEEIPRAAILEGIQALIDNGTFHPGHKLYMRRLLNDCDAADMTVILQYLSTDDGVQELKDNLYRSYGVDYWGKTILYASEDQMDSSNGDALQNVADLMKQQGLTEEEKQQQWQQIETDMFRIDNNTERWSRELDEMLTNAEIDQQAYNALKSFPSNPTQDPVEIKTIQHFMEMGPRAYHQLNVEHAKQAVKKRRRNLAILILAIIGVVIIANT